MFKVNNKNTRTTPMASFWYLINFEYVSHLFSGVSIIKFEQVNASWVKSTFRRM